MAGKGIFGFLFQAAQDMFTQLTYHYWSIIGCIISHGRLATFPNASQNKSSISFHETVLKDPTIRYIS